EQRGHFRLVIDELRIPVAQPCGIFVALQHAEFGSLELYPGAPWLDAAANDAVGGPSILLHDPGPHAGGGGLAVGATHDSIPLSQEAQLPQRLRPAHVPNAP